MFNIFSQSVEVLEVPPSPNISAHLIDKFSTLFKPSQSLSCQKPLYLATPQVCHCGAIFVKHANSLTADGCPGRRRKKATADVASGLLLRILIRLGGDDLLSSSGKLFWAALLAPFHCQVVWKIEMINCLLALVAGCLA